MAERGYRRGYKRFSELAKVSVHAVYNPSLDRFHTTNITSKGVRFHPPDALFHWGNWRIGSGGIH